MSSEQLEKGSLHDVDQTEKKAETSSQKVPLEPISTLRVPEMIPPRLSTPVIDTSPLGDFLFGNSFIQPTEEIVGKRAEVEKLSQESDQLDQQLRELSRRLEAAEQRRRSLVTGREARENPMHIQSERPYVNAGGS